MRRAVIAIAVGLFCAASLVAWQFGLPSLPESATA
jgi:hypothetical protein